jgi:hypothetical protein
MGKADFISAFAYKTMLEELGVIHYLTLDKLAEPWRRFVAQQSSAKLPGDKRQK